MLFSEIVGHSRPVAILKRASRNNTLAHAYLFSGDEGIGKKMTALALAAAVNCHDPGDDGGCGRCLSCRATASLNHPDLRIIEADGEEIKIDQIREVQAGLSLKPHEGKKKILIVNGADAMNTASANAFLKTLEEPPGETLIIMISSLPRRLLQTIRSRCQEIKFQPLPAPTLAQFLARKRGMAEEDALMLASLAQGSLGRGLAMDPEQEKATRNEIRALYSRATQMTVVEALTEAEALAKDRERLERFLTVGIEWFRDVLMYQTAGDERLLIHRYCGEEVRTWSAQISPGRMLSALALMNASRNLLDSRVSAQLVAENLFFKLGTGRDCEYLT